MTVRLRVTLPPLLREFYPGVGAVSVEAATVLDLVEGLELQLPGIAPRLQGPDGRLRSYLTLVVDGEAMPREPAGALPISAAEGEMDAWFLAAVAGG
jgi:hypothetical protein